MFLAKRKSIRQFEQSSPWKAITRKRKKYIKKDYLFKMTLFMNGVTIGGVRFFIALYSTKGLDVEIKCLGI